MRLHKPSGRRRRNENSAAGGAKVSGLLHSLVQSQRRGFCRQISVSFAPPAPRLRAAPALLVLFRGFGNLRLPMTNATGRALFPCATPQAGRPSLRSCLCLASQLREPSHFACGYALVSLRAPRSPWPLLRSGPGLLGKSPGRPGRPGSMSPRFVCARSAAVSAGGIFIILQCLQ